MDDSASRHSPLLGEQKDSRRLASAVTGLAGLASLVIALAFPAAWFLSAHNRLMGVLEISARIYAEQVSDAASQSPELWNALLGGGAVDLSDIAIARRDDDPVAMFEERRSIFAADGHKLLEDTPLQPLAWPIASWRAPVMQAANHLGDVEIARSLRPQLLETLAVAAASFVMGFLLLLVLRLIPLRLMREALDRATFLSAHDMLTGLPNRALLADRLDRALTAARREGAQVAMLCLDLDHFKEVNDTLGHAAGDLLLKSIARRLLACLRESDTLARLGGDEFAVVQPLVRHSSDATILAQRLLDTVREPISLDGQQVFVGLSIGIALSDGDTDAAELTQQADVALYRAKDAGRGGFCFFAPEMNAGLRRRRAMENDLRAALVQGGLSVHYQPQIDIATGAIIGAEALMRWDRPGHGSVPPVLFIPVAEETGLIVPMGAWLMREACLAATRWPQGMRIAVNVSPVQFRYAGFLDTVRSVLAETSLDPKRLELEVTEGILMHDTDDTLVSLAELRRLGVRLAMDDFGTGYASLGYLQKFRFDKIKIDRSFIKTLGTDPNAAAIVKAVVGLSDALGMSANAEGVENETQIAMLQSHGCREVQGYFYSPPVPEPELEQLIARQAVTQS
jgi:diguanylate cyclase (GGDEF)-like protein